MRKQQEQDGRRPGAPPWRTWTARALVAAVFLLNVTCAAQFIAAPDAYAAAYGLPASPESAAMVAGLGVAFLMWNATYPPVIAAPARFRALFAVVLAQQAIGLAGESCIWLQLAGEGLGGGLMAAGIARFAAFDAGGLVALAAAFLLTRAARAR